MANTTPIRIIVTGDSSSASRSIKDLDRNLDNTERRLRSFGSALTSLGKVTVIGSLATGAVQLTAALLPAVGILAILPAVALASAAAISTLFVGLHGISDAFKTTAGSAGGAAVNTRGLQRAIEAAARGIVTAEREVVSAERDVADAQDKVTEAQEKLDQARKDAARTIADYTDKVADAQLAEESATIALIDAQANLQTMQNNGVTDALALRKAHLDVAEAQQHLKEATENTAQTQADAQKAQADGVDGASNVVQAQKDVVQANRDLADSQQKVIDAQDQVVLANQQLADAQAALAEAGAKAAGGIDKQAEAMAKLSPNARATVQAILGLKSAWKDLHNAVQDKLFEGIAAQVKSLAANDLPVLKSGMVGVAGSFNELAIATSQALQTPMFKGAMTTAFNGAKTAVGQLVPAIGPFITGLANLSNVGMPFFTQFTGWIAHLMQSAGAFLSSAHGAQVMTGVLSNAVHILQQVWDIGKNVVTIFLNIFKGSQSGGLLQSLQNITAELAKWTGSAQGQKELTSLFTTLGQVASSTAGVLPAVATAVMTIANAFNSLPGPVKSVVANFAAWAIVMGPALGGVTKLSQGIKGATDIVQMFGSKSEIAFLRYIGVAIRAAAVAILDGAAMIAVWVSMAIEATASAIAMAAAWVIGLGPIAWLVAAAVIAIGILTAIVVQNWDTIRTATIQAWDTIYKAIQSAIGFLTDLFLNWTGPGLIIKHWDSIKEGARAAWEWISEKVGGFMTWFNGLQMPTVSWEGLKTGFKTAINWIIEKWNGLGFTLPKVSIGGHDFGGETIRPPQVGYLATGGIGKGWNWVGEQGAELVNFGSPSRVLNHRDSVAAAGGSSQPVVIHFEPSYSFGNVYGVDDLQRLLDENNRKQSEELLQLIEAS